MLALTLKRLKKERLLSALKGLSLTLILMLVFNLNRGIGEFKKHLSQRSQSTYLLVGSEKNSFDLIQNGLYFRSTDVEHMTQGELAELKVKTIPLFFSYNAQGHSIIGTTLEYFSARQLNCQEGTFFQRTGEAVIGSQVALAKGLKLGDHFFSSVNKPFDAATGIPVKLIVKGILEKSRSADDEGIFVSLKTAWTLAGIGHNHRPEEEGSLKSFTDLTQHEPENFHFHGEEANFPLTAALIQIQNSHQKVRLLARSKSGEVSLNILEPEVLLQQMINSVAGLGAFLNSLLIVFSIALLLTLSLSIILSISLRKAEQEILYSLGFPTSYFYRMIAAEWIVIFIGSALGGFLLSILTQSSISTYIRNLSGF
jgi:putative ABC transport system permease protein